MADPEIVEVGGLQLSNNTFSASPPGSLSKADNCVISQKGVIQPRNGQELSAATPSAADLPFAVSEFQQLMVSSYANNKLANYGLARSSGGVTTPYAGGPYNPLGWDGAANDYMRLHFFFAALFMHFCCANGPRTLETATGTPRRSGLSRVPDMKCLLRPPTGTQLGVVPYNSSVAYVHTHKRITSTGQVQVSPPSNRTVVTNRFLIPAGSLARAGGVNVTATISPSQIWTGLAGTPFGIGNSAALSPGDPNFAAASYVITGTLLGPARIQWNDAGANVVSTVDQELNPGPLYVRANIRLSADAVAGDIIQLFKSVATPDSSIEPSEDVYLCGEHLLTAGDIVTGSVNIDDYTPESVLKIPLYTNPSDGDGQGEAGANFPPPLYLDAANFDSRTFYLGTIGQQYLDLEMLGVGGPDGVQDGDTITVFDGVATTKTYTFRTNPAVLGDIRLISDGTPGYNIAWTTFFFTFTAGADFTPFGLAIVGGTAVNGFPGGIRLERTDYLQTPFQVKASRPTSWSPALQAAVYTNSFGSSQPNGLSWSKLDQPEAVPPINAQTAGTSSYYGRRIFGLRNSAIILKEGDGIWSLTGAGGVYSLVQISTANTIAPDCAAVFADQVWAYTDQGLLRISDTGGVQVVSRPIETELNLLASLYPNETYAWSFAVPYETERRIMFFVPTGLIDDDGIDRPEMKAYCYSAATNAWTGPLYFDGVAFSGVVSSAHRLWLGLYDTTNSGRLTEERKSDSYLDIADGSYASVLATTADPLVVALSIDRGIREGTGIKQGNSMTKVVEVLGGGLYELAESIPWSNGAVTLFNGYPVEVQFLPKGSPTARKSLTRLASLFKPDGFANYFGRATLFTDQMQDTLEIDTPAVGYGLTPYGEAPYGDPAPMIADSNPIKAKWTNAGQFFPGFKLDEVWCKFKMQGVGMHIEGSLAPVGRGK